MVAGLGVGNEMQTLSVIKEGARVGADVTEAPPYRRLFNVHPSFQAVTPYERDLLRLKEALARLDKRVPEGHLTARQAQVARSVWAEVLRLEPRPRLPSIGRHEDGLFYVSWNYPDMGLSVDIEPDGTVSWFFKDDATGVLLGTEGEPEPKLPPLFFTLARLLRLP